MRPLRIVRWGLLCLPACKSPSPALPSAAPQSSMSRSSNAASSSGSLEGHVSIGPLTPVERTDQPKPPVPPEAYASRSINIFKVDGTSLVTNVKIGPDGTYRVQLSTGTYVVNIAKSGIDRGIELPRVITIVAGQITRLDINIDTGLR